MRNSVELTEANWPEVLEHLKEQEKNAWGYSYSNKPKLFLGFCYVCGRVYSFETLFISATSCRLTAPDGTRIEAITAPGGCPVGGQTVPETNLPRPIEEQHDRVTWRAMWDGKIKWALPVGGFSK